MITDAIRSFDSFIKFKEKQFRSLPDFFKVRAVIKTGAFAIAAGLGSGLLFDSLFVSMITFTATAIYVGTGVIDRLANMPPETVKKIFGQAVTEIFSEGEKVVEDVFMGAKRGFEDLCDFFNGSNSRELEKKKNIVRVEEDLQTDFLRLVSDVWSQIKFTMTL